MMATRSTLPSPRRELSQKVQDDFPRRIDRPADPVRDEHRRPVLARIGNVGLVTLVAELGELSP